MRQILRISFLTAIWVLLWGRLSVANVLSGVIVAAVLLVLYPTGAVADTPVGRPRPIAFLRVLGYILGQVVVSNAHIAREIVTRGSNIRTGIVACRLRTDSERMITFLANVLALSPGTMPVHVQVEPPVIYVHVLHLFDPDATRRRVALLEALSVRAFGSPEAVAALAVEVHQQGAGLPISEPAISATPSDPDGSGIG